MLGRKRFEQLATLEPPPSLAGQPGAGVPWRELGDKWVETFRTWGGLRPTDDVLDVGCGAGRMALALSQFLTTGRYEGFDVQRRAIRWCRRQIEPRWPRSRFRLVDVHNDMYNPSGRNGAGTFRFPYEDRSFDFVLVTSVFTHMFSDEVEMYAGEIRRVLRPGGKVLATFFLLTPEARTTIAGGGARFTFAHRRDDACSYESAERPQVAVAYDEEWVRTRYARAGLEIEAVHHGSWSTAYGEARHSQDAVVAARPA